MNTDDKQRIDYAGLDLYTKRLKEWIFQLIRRAHARMGHIEEELARIRTTATSDYQLKPTSSAGDTITYTLMEENTMTSHGEIKINTKGYAETWNEKGEYPLKPTEVTD